ncbi:hypothetical protein AVEN_73974-1 [Araneus ventricosus]|uniref:Uncharacterized protein n=1 Tax=Araneus ventricosus TaxID=182803 RepID=A0A4Y2L0T0_ARAVE|nr:hypothetical protein AVEN_73974-1 [Araneus ventricosus]
MKKFKSKKTLLPTKFVNSADYESGAIFSSNDLRTDVSDLYKACYLTREAIRPLQLSVRVTPWVTATCHRNHSYQKNIPEILLLGYDSAVPPPPKGILQVQVLKFSNVLSKSG